MQDEIEQIRNQIRNIEIKISELYKKEPIFGIITKKHIKCGKKNCKCNIDPRYMHGPYYYLRIEPNYKYKKYLGRKIPTEILERTKIGAEIKKLEDLKKRLTKILQKLEKQKAI